MSMIGTPRKGFNVVAYNQQKLDREKNPRVIDNDSGEIAVTLNGRELRGWSYRDDAERRTKMLAAREYVEGWCDGRDSK